MYILNIPFISRPKAKILTKWIAKYIINQNWYVIDEYVELLNWSEFQWKGKYWLKFDKKIIKFRENFMDNSIETEVLSQEKLNYINNYFLNNLTTVLNHDKFTTWSNPSWSNFDFRKTPYIIYWWDYNQFLFINFFKTLRIKNKENFRTQKLQTLNLDKYIKLFPEIWKDFIKFNEILFKALNSDNESETKEIDNREDIIWIIDFILSNNYKLDLQNEDEINNQRILKLRRIFKNRLNLVKPSDHLFWKLPADMCEWAHIFPVSEIKKLPLDKWYMIADENNWLSLPIQIHKLYDTYKIHFSENWDIIFTNIEYKKHLLEIFKKEFIESKISSKILNNERKKYIKMYNSQLIIDNQTPNFWS